MKWADAVILPKVISYFIPFYLLLTACGFLPPIWGQNLFIKMIIGTNIVIESIVAINIFREDGIKLKGDSIVRAKSLLNNR
jgi:hypothetical protein